MVRKMHAGGVNHRDCYICHFLLHLPFSCENKPKLSLIDLHRAQIRRSVPTRWRNKDIVALYYSCMNMGLNAKDYIRFVRIYFDGQDIKNILSEEREFFLTLDSKVSRIAERTRRKKL